MYVWTRNIQESQKIQEELQTEGFKDIIPYIALSGNSYDCWVDQILRTKWNINWNSISKFQLDGKFFGTYYSKIYPFEWKNADFIEIIDYFLYFKVIWFQRLIDFLSM